MLRELPQVRTLCGLRRPISLHCKHCGLWFRIFYREINVCALGVAGYQMMLLLFLGNFMFVISLLLTPTDQLG